MKIDCGHRSPCSLRLLNDTDTNGKPTSGGVDIAPESLIKPADEVPGCFLNALKLSSVDSDCWYGIRYEGEADEGAKHHVCIVSTLT